MAEWLKTKFLTVQNFRGLVRMTFRLVHHKRVLQLAQTGKAAQNHFSTYPVRLCMYWDASDLYKPTGNTEIFFSYHTANSVLIFTTELMSIKRKSLFDPQLLLQIGIWPILVGMILYYLYRKASQESAKPEAKSSKKNKKK